MCACVRACVRACTNHPFTRTFALQSFSRNCSPAPDCVFLLSLNSHYYSEDEGAHRREGRGCLSRTSFRQAVATATVETATSEMAILSVRLALAHTRSCGASVSGKAAPFVQAGALRSSSRRCKRKLCDERGVVSREPTDTGVDYFVRKLLSSH